MKKFLKPLMDQNQGWLYYGIDDLMFDGTLLNEAKRPELEKKYGKNLNQLGIPRFNRGRRAFEGAKVQSDIKEMLNTADFVVTTTDHIKEAYHDIYDVPLENIIALPNLLPRYLFGDRYNPIQKTKDFGKNKNKPRIGIVSSLSHYNVDGVREDSEGKACRKMKRPDNTEFWVNEDKKEIPESETHEITDDIDAILDCIRTTVDDFQWVFLGYCPPKLQDLVKAGKIEVHGGVPIYNYASAFDNLKLQACVAAINPTEFNFCKSFIKTMECAALGVPCFATNCLPYSRVMPKTSLFDDGKQLKEMLLSLKLLNPDRYRDIIEEQWKWLNSERDEGDFHIANLWLEDNLKIFVDLYRMRSKGYTMSLTDFTKQYSARKKIEKENTIFKNDNILITR